MPPPRNSPLRKITDWSFDPWGDPADRRAWDQARKRRWIASLTERDWDRLSAATARVSMVNPCLSLDDLDAPIRVGLLLPSLADRFNGVRFGMLKGCALAAWPKD